MAPMDPGGSLDRLPEPGRGYAQRVGTRLGSTKRRLLGMAVGEMRISASPGRNPLQSHGQRPYVGGRMILSAIRARPPRDALLHRRPSNSIRTGRTGSTSPSAAKSRALSRGRDGGASAGRTIQLVRMPAIRWIPHLPSREPGHTFPNMGPSRETGLLL